MKKIFGIFFGLFLSSPFFALGPFSSIPNSSSIRKNLVETWFEASLTTVRMNKPEIHSNSAGEEFQVRMEESENTFNIFVSPSSVIYVDVYTNTGMETREQVVYPGDAPGSWVLIRDKKTGKPLRIRYYFLQNSEVFVQFSPNGKTALADLVMFGNYASRGVSTGVPFSTFYDADFDRVQKITNRTIPWNYVEIDPAHYHSIMQMSAVINERLPDIILTNDAMYDENGELIHISTGKKFTDSEIIPEKLLLSSAGFVKWIADGLVEPIAGGRLMRKPLIQETVTVKETGLQGVLSQRYNLFFSLDWIRNLASAVISVYTGKTYMFNQSGVDVTINPFASTISSSGIKNIVTFVEDSGYQVQVLKSLLYVLAVTEPGTLYLGAIRGTDRTVSPEIKAFNDCVVFLPYFTSEGKFMCSIFMNGRAFSLEDFCAFHAEDFVYLTRVKSSERFFPQ